MNPKTMTNELVTEAWLKGVETLPVEQIATTLPKDPNVWGPDGFIVVSTVGGDLSPVGVRQPVMQCSCYVASGGASKRAPWGEAGDLAGRIVTATLGPDGHALVGRKVYTQRGQGFLPAMVGDVTLLALPRRIDGEGEGIARFDVDLRVRWVPLNA